ncbi:MAG: hypothetical protein LBE78_11465 [Burkholderiaceae bacterium]|nr:hypothetical protein [Burkholderiaceae bacterium]
MVVDRLWSPEKRHERPTFVLSKGAPSTFGAAALTLASPPDDNLLGRVQLSFPG